uniref:Uncharacterized protein n=1 Tax=Heterorhabditis bacteriophora TaxID=37862 RepID=A0A1I7WFZ7_HETBA
MGIKLIGARQPTVPSPSSTHVCPRPSLRGGVDPFLSGCYTIVV